MTFVIGEACIDVLDKSCMDVCPVDCIYTGLRKNYINPAECINCSACTDVCPVDAIYVDTTVGDDEGKAAYIGDSRQFFEGILDGMTGPVGNPGGAGLRGDIGADTALVTAHPPRN
ncbi:indolepyruvate ferredoxin oxidoreductase subunit alpha [Amycolatopsis jejuensis]|uniref:indolepyruvate ferredoxin oxidoreductase subunit alpha n=1 Tax=Amycolatopsis jejuensis TaxID=330084 RepID=UPI000526BD5E|nr:4Fe-4S binding protein [Amycolatopsis jejuensis]